MKNKIKTKLRKWLEIDSLESSVNQIQRTIYTKEGLLNGFAVPKNVYDTKNNTN